MKKEQKAEGEKSKTSLRSMLACCLERDTLWWSVKLALVGGTMLALITYRQQLLARQFAPSWIVPMLIGYLTLFCVAAYGQAQGKWQRDSTRAERTERASDEIVRTSAWAALDTAPFATPPAVQVPRWSPQGPRLLQLPSQPRIPAAGANTLSKWAYARHRQQQAANSSEPGLERTEEG